MTSAIPEYGDKLLTMIGDSKKQDTAKIILKNLSEVQCVGLIHLLDQPNTAESSKILMRMLSSKESAQSHAVGNLLTLVIADLNEVYRRRQRSAEVSSSENWINMLNKPETRELAEKALRFAQSPQDAIVVAQLLRSEEGRKLIQRLPQISAREDGPSMVRTLLSTDSANETLQLVKIFDDPS